MAAPRLLSGPHDERAISVDLVRPAGFPASQPSTPLRAAPQKKSSVSSPTIETPAPASPPNVATTSVVPHPATRPTNTQQETKSVGVAIRNSIIGCSFARIVELSEAERRHCYDVFAAGANEGPDLSRLALAPNKKAAFDAAADRENFLQKPVLSARPKNGCKPFVDHQQYGQLGSSRDAYSMSFGCGKTF